MGAGPIVTSSTDEEVQMIEMNVNDMSCGGCVRAIRAALQAAVPQATLEADVPARRLRIEAPDTERGRITAALSAAGYDAVPVAPVAVSATGAPGRLGGGASGSGGCGCSGGGCGGASRAVSAG
jgi:copper chaperone